VEGLNIFSAENLEGRVDVAEALGSKATLMFIYDLAPGQGQSPYHYEYEEECCWSSRAPSSYVHPMGSTSWSEETSSAFRPGLPVHTS
jgi:hypothetical protein